VYTARHNKDFTLLPFSLHCGVLYVVIKSINLMKSKTALNLKLMMVVSCEKENPKIIFHHQLFGETLM
jgi:hypothetical protein